jgi:hypothetical protein
LEVGEAVVVVCVVGGFTPRVERNIFHFADGRPPDSMVDGFHRRISSTDFIDGFHRRISSTDFIDERSPFHIYTTIIVG